MKTIIFATILSLSLVSPALAANDPVPVLPPVGQAQAPATQSDLGFSIVKELLPHSIFDKQSPKTIVDTVFSILSDSIAALAVIGLIISGIMFITASGDPEKATRAKNSIIWIITGVVLYMLIIFILAVVRRAIDFGLTGR